MIIRRTFLFAVAATTIALVAPAFANAPISFTPQAFEAAQKAGKPILVHITASWCPTCKAQKPIVGELINTSELKDMIVFDVDFDAQKNVVNMFKARMQSTLIVFKGGAEIGRSVGDTDLDSIKALLSKAV